MAFLIQAKGPIIKGCTLQNTGAQHSTAADAPFLVPQPWNDQWTVPLRVLGLVAGDDVMDITGHFYTVAQVLPASNAIIVGSISSLVPEVFAGDVVNVYAPGTFQLLGTATISTAPVSVGEPAGIPAGAIDSVLFSGQLFFSAYQYFQVGLSPGYRESGSTYEYFLCNALTALLVASSCARAPTEPAAAGPHLKE